MAGIIVASLVCRPLIGKLGRVLVMAGLGITLAGAAGLWATVLAEGTAVSVLTMAPSILVLGAGMGACFSWQPRLAGPGHQTSGTRRLCCEA